MKQLLKLTAVSAIALMAVTSQAGVRQGAYVIAGVGYTNLNPDGKAYDGATPPKTQNLNKKSSGAEFDLIAGYEWTMPGNSWVLGAEVFGNINSTETKQTQNMGGTDTRTNKVSMDYTAGVSINPGIELGNAWSLYLKLAAVYSKFKIQHQPSAGAGYSGSSDKFGLWGFQPGVRVKWALDECWAITLDGNYAMYKQKTSKDFDPTAGGGNAYNVKIHPKVWSTVLGVSYKF